MQKRYRLHLGCKQDCEARDRPRRDRDLSTVRLETVLRPRLQDRDYIRGLHTASILFMYAYGCNCNFSFFNVVQCIDVRLLLLVQ